MSEAASAPRATPPAAAPRARRWPWRRRRGRRALTLLALGLALLLVARIALGLAAAPLLVALAERVGLHAEVGAVDLALLRGGVELRDLTVRTAPGAAPVARIDRVVANVSWLAAARGQVRLEQAEVSGLRGVFERGVDGRLVLVEHILEALRPLPRSDKKPRRPELVVLEHMRLRGGYVRVLDRSVSPPVDAWVYLQAEGWRLRPLSTSPWPGEVRLRIEAPPYFDALQLSLRPSRVPAISELRLELRGASARPIEAYGRLIGLYPLAERYDVSFRGEIDQAPALAREEVHLAVHELRLEADGAPVLRLDHATCPLTLERRLVSLGHVRASGLHVAGGRGEDGSFTVAGFRFGPRQGRRAAPEVAPGEELGPPSLPTTVQLASFAGEGFELALAAPAAPLPARLRVERLALGPLTLPSDPAAPPGAAAALELRASAPGLVSEVAALGTLSVARRALACELALAASGVDVAAVASLVPGATPVASTLALTTTLRASVALRERRAPAREPALAVDAALRGLTLVAAGEPRLHVDALAVRAPDLRRLRFEHVGVEGLELAVAREESGALRALGLRLEPGDEEQADSPPSPARVEPAARGERPRRGRRPPSLALDSLQLGVRRLAFRAEGRAPLVLRDAVLRTTGPVEVRADLPAQSPPIEVQVTGALTPVTPRFELSASVTPSAAAPEARLTLEADRLDLEGLLAAVGQAPPQLEVSAPLDLGLQAAVALVRGGPIFGVDGAREPLELEAQVTDLALTSPAVGEAATVRAIVARARFDPAGAGLSLESVEVHAPRLRISRHEGYHELLGVRLYARDERAPPPPEPAEADERLARRRRAPPPVIRRVALYEGEVELLDATGEEPVRLPIENVQVHAREVPLGRGAERPLRFVATARGGDVLLPERVTLGGAIGNFVRDWIRRFGGDERQLERRPLFEQLAIRGSLEVGEPVTGRLDLRLAKLEVAHLEPLIPSEGLEISDGLLDAEASLVFEPDDDLELDAVFELRHLTAEEPIGGPVMRFVGLPTPLDTAIFLLQDAERRIRIPIELQLDRGTRPERLGLVVLRAVGQVVSRAIVRSPYRVVRTVERLGRSAVRVLSGGGLYEPVDPALEAAPVPFPPAAALPEPRALDAALAPLEARLAGGDPLVLTLRHEVGYEDLAAARRWANPSAHELAALIEALARCEAELAGRRATLRAAATEALRAGRDHELERLRRRLRGVTDALGRVRRARGDCLELYAPGAESAWAFEQRTRVALEGLAAARLEAVADALRARNLPGAPGRIEVLPPLPTEPRDGRGRVVVLPHAAWAEATSLEGR